MGVQLLGPAQISGVQGRLGPRDRVILSALCVEPGNSVPPDTLAEALWGDEPPKSWSKVVQGSVMRLRRVLGTDAILTTALGYQVPVDRVDLDTVEFERLAARGREFLALNQPERAATTFRAALALWRGDPFPELADWPPAQAQAARLLELRRAVEEDLVAAELAAGRAIEAAATAGPLVAREPFRERRWALLATALYRGGRQGDALEVLRRAATTLREELGLDPSRDLVDLERRMLRQDPALLEVPTRGGGSTETCPYRGLRAFEAKDEDFYFGRRATVEDALRRLDRSSLLLVVGPSGSGKSSFVRAGVVPALARTGRTVTVLTPGPDPVATLSAAVAALPTGGVMVTDQLEEAFALHRPEDSSLGTYLDRLADLVDSGTPVIATLRADYLGSLGVSPRLARLAEQGLLLLTPLTDEELREAIEGPAHLVGLVLEPGLVDLLVRDVQGAPGGLPLLSHALVETWAHRERTVMTVEGYRATGGIHSAVAITAERLYESLAPEDREVLRSVLQRLVTTGPTGDPVVTRVPARVFAGTPDAPRILDLLVRARLVTTAEDSVTVAHESLVRAWPRLRTWLDDDVEGLRILAHLQVAADTWQVLSRPDEELYRGARLAAAREWQARTRAVLAPVEAEFLSASTAAAEAEQVREHRAHAAQVRRNRQLAGALTALVALLMASLLAGTLAGLRGRQAQQAAARADAAAVDARAARLGTTAIAEPSTALSLLLARQAVALSDAPVTQGALLQSLIKAGGLAGLADASTSPPSTVTRDHTVSPDGSRLLELNADGAIHLLDTTTGRSLAGPLAGSDDQTWTYHPAGLVDGGRTALVAAPTTWRAATQTPPTDASAVADPAEEGAAVLVAFDTTTGTQSGPAQPVPGARAAGFMDLDRMRVSADGRTLVSVLDETARIWHLREGSWEGPVTVRLRGLPVTEPGTVFTTGLTVSADGTHAQIQMIGQNGEYGAQRVAVVVDTVQPRQVGPVLASARQGSGLWQTAISPDGSRTLAGELGTGLVRVLDVRTGRALLSIPGDSPASALAWSADGRQVAIGRIDGTREVYSLAPLQQVARLSGSELVVSLAFTSAGLVSQDIVGTIARLDLTSPAPVIRAVPAERIHAVATAGTTIAAGGGDGRVTLFDRSTLSTRGKELSLGPYRTPDTSTVPAIHRRVTALAFLPDGSALIAADRTGHLRMWSLPDRTVRWSRDDVPTSWLAVSPDGRYLATAGFTPADDSPDGAAEETRLTIWDLATRTPVFVDDFTDRDVNADAPSPRDLVFSPDSRRLAVSFNADLVRLYDVDARVRTAGMSTNAESMDFTADSARLVGTSRGLGKLVVWDAVTGRPLESAWAPRATELSRMRFTGDGRWLVASHDRSVTILDGATLQVAVSDLALPNDGTGDAFALAPTADGHMLVGTQTSLVEIDLNPTAWGQTACRLAGRRLTTLEWERFLPALAYHPAC